MRPIRKDVFRRIFHNQEVSCKSIYIGIWYLWIGLLFISRSYAQSGADFAVIGERLTTNLLSIPVDDQHIKRIITSMADEGTWPSIDYQDTSRTGFAHRVHLGNLLTMAKAYRQAESAYHCDPRLLSVFKSALHHWLAKDYRCENWWWNEIGTPDAMANILLLMREKLSSDELAEGLAIAARSNFDAFGARPGGDFIKMAAINAVTEWVRQDTAAFALAIKTMSDQIYVTEDRGIKPDMSFHHRTDGVPSTLSYGRQYASSFAYWADIVRGTRFAFDPRAVRLVIDYYLDGMRKAMPFGRFDDPGIKNREVSRKSSISHRDDHIASLLARISNYRKEELEHPNLRSNQYFWHSHYHSHQRSKYFASVRMYSNRSNNIESPYNEEGLKNHFYAEGSQFISRTGREYLNIYPSWDWQKIPGTTVAQTDTFPHWKNLVKKGTSSFAGGVSDGEYGAATFDLVSPHSGLKAHKSWFFFDDEIVCLGAGITATQPVVTTLNQSLSSGAVWVNGKQGSGEQEQQINGPAWINHDSTGYIVLTASRIGLRQGNSTGTWRSISHQDHATDEPVTQHVFTLTIDHGMHPQGATYAYIVLPATDESHTQSYARQSPIEIISNTDALQAVSNRQLGIHYAIFYEPGKVVFPGGVHLATNEPALFMIKSTEDRIEQISVADPTRKLEKITFQLGLAKSDSTLTVQLPHGPFAGKSLRLGAIPETVSTFLLHSDTLLAHRNRIWKGDRSLSADLDSVLRAADKAMMRGPYSVVEKEKMPPSGDKHDYMSVGPYWWPDTTKPDGLPYIRKDGQTNPERFAINDAQYLKDLCADVQLLAVSYYFTQNDKYAAHAATLLNTWFLDARTKMNPNLNFGQSIPGITDGRGIGLIDTWSLVKLLDATRLLRLSPYWHNDQHAQLQAWVGEFLRWMRESDIGKDEADEHNNHGTYYDVQLVGYGLFVGDTALVRQTLENQTKARLESQLEVDGSQPHELARTRSWSYSLMNLTGFFALARLGENIGIDLWSYQTPQGKSIGQAFKYLQPYGLQQQPWTRPQLGQLDVTGFYKLTGFGGQRYVAEKWIGDVKSHTPPFNRLTGSFL